MSAVFYYNSRERCKASAFRPDIAVDTSFEFSRERLASENFFNHIFREIIFEVSFRVLPLAESAVIILFGYLKFETYGQIRAEIILSHRFAFGVNPVLPVSGRSLYAVVDSGHGNITVLSSRSALTG